MTPSSIAAPTNPSVFCSFKVVNTSSSVSPRVSKVASSKLTSKTISAEPVNVTSATPGILFSSFKISRLIHSVLRMSASSSVTVSSKLRYIVTFMTGNKSGDNLKIVVFPTPSGNVKLLIISLNSTVTLSKLVPSWNVTNEIAKFSLDCEVTVAKFPIVETAASRGSETELSISSGLAPG